MRRIIERVVTVVTTTTWTISWKDDSLHSQPEADPVPENKSQLQPLQNAQPSEPPAKEVNLSETTKRKTD